MNDSQRKLYDLASKSASSTIDFLIEYPIYTTDQLTFREAPHIRLGNIPGILLPTGMSFYLCRATASDFKEVWSSPSFAGKWVSDTWQNLWQSNYIFRNHIFEGEGTWNGSFWRNKLVNTTQSTVVQKVYPPGVFLGDNVPILLDIEVQRHVAQTIFEKKEVEVRHVNEELIEQIRLSPGSMKSLSSRRFEELIASILKNQGFKVFLTKQTRDGGYDIICTSKKIDGTDFSFIVECKRYDEETPVGLDVARSVLWVKENRGANQAMIVTSSYFSNDLIELKSSRYDLHLIDYQAIIAWLNEIEGKK